jgi:hypothetical protein
MYIAQPDTYIALQDQIVHNVDDMRHCLFLSARAARGVRELDRFAIAQ